MFRNTHVAFLNALWEKFNLYFLINEKANIEYL